MRIVNEDQWTVQFGNWEGAATTFEPWVEDGGGYGHPDYPNLRAAQPTPTGTPVNPYALGQPGSGVCRASTGT